ncbi:hypothetical protein F0562_019895 [Nyssa sinensis]|uniref:Protein kinase domain-containing protein n=1 Tax=Nyssa sinensis TaxID=561372 RepID=A0A5J5BV15_9ASTE|nr:hypothetical protein F0562_019895 [Nyssa sinensis]
MSNEQIHFIAVTVFLSVAFCALPSTLPLDCKNFTDCQSLLKFKEGLSDPDGHLQAWNVTSFFCNWTGVTCHPHLQNRVIALELINMGLRGRISPYISNLSLLTTLSLQDNSFYGDIPTSLGNLSELTYVNMSGNKPEGSIPGALQGCHSLKIVDLNSNNLSGNIPYELGQLKNLTFLALSVNNLTGVIPEWISNLTELTNLQLAVNYFTGKIPQGIGSLTKLETMYFHTNYFEGTIPASISNCTALRQITLTENLLTGEIPAELGAKLYNLERLYLWDNRLTGWIPVTLSNLSQLTLLYLSLNKLEGEVPPELGKLQKLEILYLHSNDLVSSSTNSSLSFLTALTNCSFLQKLHLGDCLFAGSLPASIGDLSKDLYYLNLRNNRISGEIPDGVGNLSSLVSLYLQDNFLNGMIPVGQSLLHLLDLSYNNLQGSLPTEISRFLNLALSLNLSNNNLEGELPASIGNLASVQAIDLSENKFSRAIPSAIGKCISLEYLNLSNNMLEGTIPDSLKQITHLTILDLAFNKLSGNVPFWIRDNQMIKHLNLSYNRLTGKVPNTGRFENLGRSSFIGNAGLCSDSETLGLPPCKVEKQKHKKRKWLYYVLAISISCALLFFVFVVVFVCLRYFKSEIEESEASVLMASPRHYGSRTFTQRELEIATGGFDEANLLGKGSFGSVYKANIDEGKTILAVKVLHKEYKPKGYASSTGFLHGSIGYIPPEYGQGIEVSTMGDVYSFGVMMLEMITRKRPTSEMFSNGLDPRKWVLSAFPNHILDVVDISLVQEAGAKDVRGALSRLEQCCTHMLDVGIMCTEKNPRERPPISLVAKRLKNAWKEMGFEA